MFDNTDKRKLYWLIEEYLADKIAATVFCDEFYYCFDLELDLDSLSDIERAAFLELSNVNSRYSQFEEDIRAHPGVYCTETELRSTVVDTKLRLESASSS